MGCRIPATGGRCVPWSVLKTHSAGSFAIHSVRSCIRQSLWTGCSRRWGSRCSPRCGRSRGKWWCTSVKQILRACGAQDDRRAAFFITGGFFFFLLLLRALRVCHPERARGTRAQRRIVAALPSCPKVHGKRDQHTNGPSAKASMTELCL